jgi:ABC-type lipoprotein export system ATPase subunit
MSVDRWQHAGLKYTVIDKQDDTITIHNGDNMNTKTEKRDQLIVKITALIFNMAFIESASLKEKISIGRHIANMPKKARVQFINALISAKYKSKEYDEMQYAGDQTYCIYENVQDRINPKWNK